MNRLALGTVQFGLDYGIANRSGQVSLDEARRIVVEARASGMDTLDTAIGYGESEQRLGEIGIADWLVVSKLPAMPEGCTDVNEWMSGAVNASLQRLGVRGVYGMLLHRPQQLLEAEGDRLYAALQALKRDGLVRKIGVSIYDPAELDALGSRYRLDLVQAPFNILDRRLVDSGWLARLAEHGGELHVRSVFLQGLLLMKPGERPQAFERWSSLWTRWDNWLAQHGLTPLQACLRYALSFPGISRVVVGVDSVNQLKAIVADASGAMPRVPDDLQCPDMDLINPSRWAAA